MKCVKDYSDRPERTLYIGLSHLKDAKISDETGFPVDEHGYTFSNCVVYSSALGEIRPDEPAKKIIEKQFERMDLFDYNGFAFKTRLTPSEFFDELRKAYGDIKTLNWHVPIYVIPFSATNETVDKLSELFDGSKIYRKTY